MAAGPPVLVEIHQDEVLTGEAVALDVQPLGYFLQALGALIDALVSVALLVAGSVILGSLVAQGALSEATATIAVITLIVVVTVVVPTVVRPRRTAAASAGSRWAVASSAPTAGRRGSVRRSSGRSRASWRST